MGSWLFGALTARAGDEMSGPALTLAGLAVTGSAAEASSLLAGLTIAAALGGPVLGVLLDRAVRPGRLLAAALALYATGLAVAVAGLGHLPIAAVVAVAVVTGLAGPALSGGWTAQLARVVPQGRRARANALDAMTFDVAGLVGPALAGVTAEALGAPAAVVVSVVLIAVAVPAAWTMPAVRRSAQRADSASMLGGLAAGTQCIARSPRLARATLASCVSCVAGGVPAGCLPLLGERVLGAAGYGAALLSCTALSALAANAVLARFPLPLAPDTVVRAGALVRAVAPALAATGRPDLLVAAAVVAGIGEGPQLAALFAVRHRDAPENLRAQIFTTGASLKITGFALGAAVSGPAAARSLPGALLSAAGVAVLAGLAFRPVPPAVPAVPSRPA
ncbi:MFS transporter [Streptomyces sp. MTZ3.1]|uniref:MFS transporter n=2 Tax=Streptomyces meridianus TaxID=2938945 RepID=A0ABT0X1Q0_9ACTN|nr:MFS transporter [Streptomyces meridianus]MCM2576471.1 MFS transporter [Streptomyces meridianus]